MNQAKLSERSPSLDDANQYNDDSDNQQDMNESANRIATDESQKPQNQENYEDGPQHLNSPLSDGGVDPRISGNDLIKRQWLIVKSPAHRAGLPADLPVTKASFCLCFFKIRHHFFILFI